MAVLLIPVLLSYNFVEDGVLLFLTALLLLLAVKEGAPLSDDPVCDKGYYLNTTCIPCTICAEGQGVRFACEDRKDTVCNPCSDRQYSKQISGNRLCTNCTNCSSLNRNLVSTCTREKNTICGSCTKGYFLQINRDGSTYCAECSLCPPGEEAVRWYECADMPESHQCAPGYTEQSSVEPVVTKSSENSQWEVEFVKLTNRTVFLPVAIQKAAAENQPWYQVFISVVSLAFTLLTVCVFSCALHSFLKGVYRRCRSPS